MNSNKVLITDSLFIYSKHEALLVAAGFRAVRLDKPKASEDELIHHLVGAVGYILGGIEHVTDRVINSTTELRAISFTGSGYHEFIPGAAAATKRGVAIAAAVGGNASAVAEYAATLTLTLQRHIPELTTPGLSSFMTVRGFHQTTVGIVGYGAIGRKYAALVAALGFNVLIAQNPRTPEPDRLGLDEVMRQADIVSIHVSKPHGIRVLGAAQLALLRDGATVINTAFPDAVDMDAMEAHLAQGRLYYAMDASHTFSAQPKPGHCILSNAQTAFNTAEANEIISDRATRSLLNLLTHGSDDDLVNPEYRQFRSEAK